ncbi:MAG: NAD-dependent epimerase/dehydratase family protein [Bacteroidota bacterium]
MKRLFVTGGDGLLGSNLVRELLQRGYELTVMVQPGRKVSTLDGLDLETVEGDLLDKQSVSAAMKGAEGVVHIAALTNVWPSRGEIYHRINVEGTQHLVDAALEHGVQRMVHVGSASSFFYGDQANPGTEEKVRLKTPYGLDYIDTKTAGQELVLKAVREQGLPAVVVNPTFMIGAYDSKPSSGAMIVALAKGKVPGYTAGGKNWVHVRDVAIGACLALEKGQIGECYIMGHENLTYQEAFQRMATAIGHKPPGFGMPSPLVKLAGLFGSAIGKLTGNTPALSYPMARVSCDGHYFSPAKAVQELGMPQTPIEEAAKDAYAWFQANGYL